MREGNSKLLELKNHLSNVPGCRSLVLASPNTSSGETAGFIWFPNEDIIDTVEVAANDSARGLGEMWRNNQGEYEHNGYCSLRLCNDVWPWNGIVDKSTGGLEFSEVEHWCQRDTTEICWGLSNYTHFGTSTTPCKVRGSKAAASTGGRIAEDRPVLKTRLQSWLEEACQLTLSLKENLKVLQ